MISTKERYLELLSLTQLYLMQEYGLTDRITESQETFEYFRKSVQQQKKTIPELPATPVKAPLVAIPPPPKPVAIDIPVPSVPIAIPPVLPVAKPSPVVNDPPPPKNISAPESKEKVPLFTVEAPPPAAAIDLQDLRKILNEKLPHFKFIDQIPDDAEGRRLAMGWTQAPRVKPVAILSFDEPQAHREFLANVAKAIEGLGAEVHIYEAKKVEQAKEWDALFRSSELKFVICSNSGLHSLPGLQKSHREVQKSGRHFLGECPLLLLSDIGFYLQEPSLKASLWRAIKEMVAIHIKP